MKKLVAVIFLLCLCPNAAAESVMRIVARVNNEIITSKDLDDYIKIVGYRLGKDSPSFSSSPQDAQFRREALEKLIEDKLILAQAHKEQIDIPSSLIEDKLEEFIAGHDSRQEFEDFMVERGLNLTLLRKRIKEQYLMRQVIETYVHSAVTVSPQEISQYYQEHYADFCLPPRCFLWVVKAAQEEVVREVAAVIDREGIDAAQEKYPELLIKVESGREELKEEIATVIAQIKEGDYLIREIEGSYHLIYLAKKDFSPTISLEEAKGQIYAFLHDKKIRERFGAWIQEAKKTAVIKVYP